MRNGAPPGPRYAAPFAVTRQFRRDPLGFAMRLHEEFGDFVSIRMGSRRSFYLFSPEDIEYVLQGNSRNYLKGPSTDKVRVFFGKGLFSSEGAAWRAQRLLLQTAFERQRLESYAETMADCVTALLDGWDRHAARGSAVDLVAEMKRFALGVVARTLFGAELDDEAPELTRAFALVLEHLNHRATSFLPVPDKLPTPRNLRFHNAQDLVERFVLDLVGRRQKAAEPGADMLATLLAARDPESGLPLTQRELRDQILTFLMAGHETTAATMAWGVHLLARHPDVQRRVRAEVAESLVDGRVPSGKDVRQLAFTHRVVQETLRLYPPAPFVARQPIAPDTIHGYHIPAHSSVTVCTYATHRHRQFWDDPERFDPDRLTPERCAARPRHAYLPFGGGPRICIGNDFALLEEQMLLAMAIRRYRIIPDPSRPFAAGVRTVRAPNGLWVRLEPVSAHDEAAARKPG
jgi:cytochrome P450